MTQTTVKTKTTCYDVAEHLRGPEELAVYLDAGLEEAGEDEAFLAKALGDVARAKGMTQVARDVGRSRESLYKALSGERSPGFGTILKVCSARPGRTAARRGHAGLTVAVAIGPLEAHVVQIDPLTTYARGRAVTGETVFPDGIVPGSSPPGSGPGSSSA